MRIDNIGKWIWEKNLQFLAIIVFFSCVLCAYSLSIFWGLRVQIGRLFFLQTNQLCIQFNFTCECAISQRTSKTKYTCIYESRWTLLEQLYNYIYCYGLCTACCILLRFACLHTFHAPSFSICLILSLCVCVCVHMVEFFAIGTGFVCANHFRSFSEKKNKTKHQKCTVALPNSSSL